MRPCTRCKNGRSPAIKLDNGTELYGPRPCRWCDGTGQFPPPDYELLRALVINPKTHKPWSTSFHCKAGRARVAELSELMARRAQYVWRMIGWNTGSDGRGANLGGAIMASMDLGKDAYRAELDGLADLIADQCYGAGASLSSAKRWHRALHGN